MSSSLHQPAPRSENGANWYVFDHLIEAEIAAPGTSSSMNSEQREVLALNYLRQEVNSGGFESYFRFKGGDTALVAERASSHLLGQHWQLLISEAVRVFGDDYPAYQPDREKIVDELFESRPGRFDRLDSAFYDLEADQSPDERLDAFIWAHRDSFFN